MVDTEIFSMTECLSIVSDHRKSNLHCSYGRPKAPQTFILWWTAAWWVSATQSKEMLKRQHLKSVKINILEWEVLVLRRFEWRETFKTGCASFEESHKRHCWTIRFRTLLDVCDHFLFSKAGYVNCMLSHRRCKQHTFHFRLDDATCIIYSKVCKSLSGLNRHMAIHQNFFHKPNPVTFTVITPFVCHLCPKVCKTVITGLKSNLWGYGQ